MSALPHPRLDPAPRGARGRALRLAWPLPALLAWTLAWGVHGALAGAGFRGWSALLLASLVPVMVAALLSAGTSDWRRGIVAAGFPVSAAATGLAGPLPAWAWLLPLGLLWLAYPKRAWRDAPMFPTPAQALDGLGALVQLPEGASVLDAGCGMGHGLQALRRALPGARLHGVEWSWPLRLLAAWRCPQASVRQGDMWACAWGEHDLVYLFQRPETMARAWQQATAQMRPGAWLVSLEFPVPGVVPTHRLDGAGGKPAWVYRLPGQEAQPDTVRADNSGRARGRRTHAPRVHGPS